PDDMHMHFRDDHFLKKTVSDAMKQFGRAIAMPNLKPPIKNLQDALAYEERILSYVGESNQFKPLMTLYLTDEMTPDIIYEASASNKVFAVKLYPAGVTTNSEFGVSKIENMMPVFSAMADCDMPLLIHGEASDP